MANQNILRCDDNGFLIGEPLDLSQAVDRLDQMAEDLRAIRAALGMGSAQVQSQQSAPPVVTVPSVTAPGVVVDVQVVAPAGRPNAGVVNQDNRVTNSTQNAPGTTNNNSTTTIPQQQAASPRQRNARGQFERNHSAQNASGNAETIEQQRQRDNRLAERIGEAVSESAQGMEQMDATAAAIGEVVRPLGRGFTLLGLGDKSQDAWLKKIWKNLEDMLDALKNGAQRGGQQGGGLLGGLANLPPGGGRNGRNAPTVPTGGRPHPAGGGGLRGMTGKVPLIGGLLAGLFAGNDVTETENDVALTRREKDERNGGAIGGVGGMLAGGMAGAAMGSALGPVGTVIGGVVGAWLGQDAGAIIGEKVGGWVNDLRSVDLGGLISSAWESALAGMSAAWSGLMASMSAMWEGATRAIGDAIGGMADGIKAGFSALKQGAIAALDKIKQVIKEATGVDIDATVKSVKQSAVNLANATNNAIRDATGVDIKAKAQEAFDAVKQGGEKLKERAEGIVSQGVTVVKKGAGQVGEAITQGASKAKEVAGKAVGAAGEAASQQWKAITGERDAEIVAKLQSRGLTREQALGVAANLKQESGNTYNSKAEGDGGKAYGIAQWHPARQADFKDFAGKDIRESSEDEQLDFILHELQNKEAAAGRKLFAAKTPAEAAEVFSRYYERPLRKDEEAKSRAASAERMAKSVKTVPDGAQATPIAKDSSIPPVVAQMRVKDSDGKTRTLDEKGVKSWGDLQKMGGQAFAGGHNDPATTYATSIIQQGLGDSFDRMTAQNDLYHQGTSSEHTQGNKTDFSVRGDPKAAIVKMNETLAAQGLVEGKDYKVLDEYAKPTARATGGHIDFKLTKSGQDKMNAKMAQAQAERDVANAQETAKPGDPGASSNKPVPLAFKNAANPPDEAGKQTDAGQAAAQATPPSVAQISPPAAVNAFMPPSAVRVPGVTPTVPTIQEQAAVSEPLTTSASKSGIGDYRDQNPALAGQDLRDRRIAHVATGGLSNPIA